MNLLTVQINIKVDAETAGRWRDAAARDRRPLSQWARIALDAAAVPLEERQRAAAAAIERVNAGHDRRNGR